MQSPNQTIILSLIIPATYQGKRLDQALAELLPDYSRSRIQLWIKNGELTVNGRQEKSKLLLHGGEKVNIQAAPIAQENWIAQDIPLNIVYEDDDILIINKPAGLVVHPAAGNFDKTLVNALLHYLPSQANLPRAGIIHRLDKDTTGLLMIAKSLAAHTHLIAALQAREITRIYQCVVNGTFISGGTIDANLDRHPRDRLRRAVVTQGKKAITHYRILTHFRRHTHLQVQLETGRTHQIRVHMEHIKHPLVGDKIYGGRVLFPPKATDELKLCLQNFPRPALHAQQLILLHPITQERFHWELELPNDMQVLLQALQEDKNHDSLAHN